MIPVILVTGFLGSGKTTFLRRLAETHPDWRMVFLVNEIADLSVDGPTLSATGTATHSVVGGSLFCECKAGDFLRIMREEVLAIHRQNTLDAVVIETSGTATLRRSGNSCSTMASARTSSCAASSVSSPRSGSCPCSTFSTIELRWPRSRSLDEARAFFTALPEEILRIKGQFQTPEGHWTLERTVDTLKIEPAEKPSLDSLVLIAHDDHEALLRKAAHQLAQLHQP